MGRSLSLSARRTVVDFWRVPSIPWVVPHFRGMHWWFACPAAKRAVLQSLPAVFEPFDCIVARRADDKAYARAALFLSDRVLHGTRVCGEARPSSSGSHFERSVESRDCPTPSIDGLS